MSVQVKIHVGAVRECMRSAGVRSVIQRECDAAAARCNDLVEWHSPDKSPMRSPAYSAHVDDGEYTAVGKVAMNRLGRDGLAVVYEDAAHNTLLKGCGW